MKATNDYKVTGHNRTIRFTDIPDTGRDPITQMDVTVNYTGEGNSHKGVVIDSIILPAIMRGLKSRTWVVNATMTVKTPDGTTTRQVPTFLLDSDIQGITSAEHAVIIAHDILNPTKNVNVTVSVHVEPR